MMKLLPLVFLLALNAIDGVDATRARARILSIYDAKAEKSTKFRPSLVKRNKAGREIDRSFLVDMFDPDSNEYEYLSMSMSMSLTSPPSPAPSRGMTEPPSPAPSEFSEPPSPAPSVKPTNFPSPSPSIKPTYFPFPAPSVKPADSPSPAPSPKPTNFPSPAPSAGPTESPSSGPSQPGNICHCAPNKYTFSLDFSLSCTPVNIPVGDGIADTDCSIDSFADDSVTDLVPVVVQAIDVLELDQDLSILSQTNFEGDFEDGDTFEYTSIAATPGIISCTEERPTEIPRAIQLNIVGLNQNDEAIINVYILLFTNSCGFYPVLFEGQSAGWTVFTDLGPPDQTFCPLAPPPTEPPTSGPSELPSEPPSPSPTLLPSAVPSSSSAPTPCGKGGCESKSTKAPSTSNDERRKARKKRQLVRGKEA